MGCRAGAEQKDELPVRQSSGKLPETSALHSELCKEKCQVPFLYCSILDQTLLLSDV